MKKFLVVLGVIVVLVVVALATIPLVYDVDAKVKPMIVQLIEENLNAKADIGKLSMSLWGKVHIHISSLMLSETVGNTKVFDVKDAELQIPFISLLSGKIDVTFVASEPQINLIAGTDGKLNALKMLKPSAKTADAAAPKNGGSSSAAAGLGSRVFLSTNIRNALVSYQDLKSGMNSTIKNLDLELVDVGVNHPFQIKSEANLAIKGQGMSLSGPMVIAGTSEIKMGDQGFERFTLKTVGDLNNLSIEYGRLFKKGPKTPLGVEADIAMSPSMLDLNAINLVVNDLKVTTQGHVKLEPEMDLDVKVKSNKMAIENWKNIIGPIGDFGVTGKASFDLAVQGTLAKLAYQGGFNLENGTAKAPGFRVPATDINVDVDLKTDLMKIQKASMKFGKSDLGLTGSIADFMAPKVRMDVRSALLDLDEMLPASTPETAQATAKQNADEANQDVSFEGPIAMLKKNPIMRKLDFSGRTQFKKMVVHKAELTNVDSEVEFKNLVMNVKKATLNAFSGKADMSLVCDFNGKEPVYKTVGSASGVDLNAALTSQFADLKDSAKGSATAKFAINGSGAKMSEVKKNLRGNGTMNIANGSWSALAGLKMLAEKLGSIPGAKDKVSGVVVGDKFKTAKANFEIKDAKMYLQKAEVDMEGSRTTLHMDGWVSFEKMLAMKGDILAPLTNPPRELRAPDGRAKLPFEVEGALMSPNVKWETTTRAIANAYLKDEGAKALNQGLKNLKQNTKDPNVKKLLDKLPANASDLLKGIKF